MPYPEFQKYVIKQVIAALAEDRCYLIINHVSYFGIYRPDDEILQKEYHEIDGILMDEGIGTHFELWSSYSCAHTLIIDFKIDTKITWFQLARASTDLTYSSKEKYINSRYPRICLKHKLHTASPFTLPIVAAQIFLFLGYELYSRVRSRN